MRAETGGRLADASEVGSDILLLRSPGKNEVRVVWLRAFEVINHQVASMSFDRALETFDRLEESGQRLCRVLFTEGNPTPAKAGLRFQRRCLLFLFTVRIERAIEVFGCSAGIGHGEIRLE